MEASPWCPRGGGTRQCAGGDQNLRQPLSQPAADSSPSQGSLFGRPMAAPTANPGAWCRGACENAGTGGYIIRPYGCGAICRGRSLIDPSAKRPKPPLEGRWRAKRDGEVLQAVAISISLPKNATAVTPLSQPAADSSPQGEPYAVKYPNSPRIWPFSR